MVAQTARGRGEGAGPVKQLLARTVYSDPWIGQVGLGLIATGTAIFFALPLHTFATFPASYRLMAAVLPQEGWAACFAAVATATWIALWLGETPQGERLSAFLFGFVHGPLWFFVAYSAISATPAAFFPWWSMAGFALAEFIAIQPVVRDLWERGGVGRGDRR